LLGLFYSFKVYTIARLSVKMYKFATRKCEHTLCCKACAAQCERHISIYIYIIYILYIYYLKLFSSCHIYLKGRNLTTAVSGEIRQEKNSLKVHHLHFYISQPKDEDLYGVCETSSTTLKRHPKVSRMLPVHPAGGF